MLELLPCSARDRRGREACPTTGVVHPVERTSSVSSASTSAAVLSRVPRRATLILSPIFAAASAAKGEVKLMESAMLSDSCEKMI